MKDKIIKFLKSKDFVFIEELGRGACGRTVKLYDQIIDETFVCKKYEPFADEYKESLFGNFIHEIKLLYLVNHPNIVRVFNYYIYPELLVGYILMEYVVGKDIESYLASSPQMINDIFLQCIDGFVHLEKNNILHRDIRPMNIMVSDDATLKIIDFGFGKKIGEKADFDKSISLNWWCEPPTDFKQNLYDFKTEIYFVGKLFEKIIKEREIGTFKYKSILSGMSANKPELRLNSFAEIKSKISEDRFFEVEFTKPELTSYREFSNNLYESISKIETDCNYFDDPDLIQKKLENYFRRVMLEENLPNNTPVISCFLNGAYYFKRNKYFPVSSLKSFIELLRSCSKDKKNIIINNLCSKLDAIQRYTEAPPWEGDVPF